MNSMPNRMHSLAKKLRRGEKYNFRDLAVFDKYYYLNVVKCAVDKSYVFSYKV